MSSFENRVLDGLACARCGTEPAEMVPDGFGERGQLFRCADGCSAGETGTFLARQSSRTIST